MKILLLEDNIIDADLTKRGLKASFPNCIIEHASSLKQAREFLNAKVLFDIALLDVNLPDGNGLGFLIEIRQQKLNFPVVMLTGSGDEDTAVTALKTGADDYIVKRPGYILHLTNVIDLVITNFKEHNLYKSEVIDVLYIEHHAVDIDFTLRHIAQYAPYIHIDSVPTAEEALLKLEEGTTDAIKYKVIVMDYRLPGMDALELIKTIRQNKKLCIPIILVTGQGSEELAVQALKLGANDYLTKSEKYLYRLPSVIVNSYQHCELMRKQEALVESESKYRFLADNAGDVIFVLDMNLKYTYISPAVKILRELEPEEAMKQKVVEVLTPDSYQKVLKVLSEILAENKTNPSNSVLPKSIELEMIRKDNTTIWVEVKASLITDENNNPTGILGITRDISERKSISDKLRKLSHAVEQSPAQIIITDTKGNIEYVNSKFTEITGYSLQEVFGKNANILKSGYTPKIEYENLWNTIKSGSEWKGEFQNKRKDGSLYWEDASITSIKTTDGLITHFLVIKSDITEKKKMIDDLIIAKNKAEESDRLKSAFLANISHEIRTPMNGILGFAELLKEPKLTGTQQQRFIQIIEKSGIRMLKIINDIVDISKIEAGLVELRLSETNINEQIEDAYTFFKPDADKKGIQIFLKTSLPNYQAQVKTYQEKLYSILLNLIKNAIKYTDSGKIEFGYELKHKKETAYLEFFVSDTGIGIPVERQEAIFERFIQADIVDRQARQGAGLGLSIAKAYAELMGGKMWVESEKGKGSIFYFTLPYIPVHNIKEPILENMDVSNYGLLKKIKILIADDDECSEQLLSIMVSPIVNELLIARNGLEAIEICKANTDIDLILMDIQMPIVSGYEAVRQIRLFNNNVVIIAQTAFALSGDEEKFKLIGCNGYVSKPIIKANLLLTIKNLFNKP